MFSGKTPSSIISSQYSNPSLQPSLKVHTSDLQTRVLSVEEGGGGIRKVEVVGEEVYT